MSLVSLSGEELVQIVNLLNIYDIQKVCFASRVIGTKLASSNLYLHGNGFNECGMPLKYVSSLIIRQLKGWKSLSLSLDENQPDSVRNGIISSLPSSLTHLSLKGSHCTDPWNKMRENVFSLCEGLTSLPRDMMTTIDFPNLTSLVLIGGILDQKRASMIDIIKKSPSSLTRLEVRCERQSQEEEELEHLKRLPLSLKMVALPLKESNVLEWILRLSDLETLELPQLSRWMVSATDKTIHSLTRLKVPVLYTLEESTNPNKLLAVHEFFSDVFPLLKDIEFSSDRADCCLAFPRLERARLGGNWCLQDHFRSFSHLYHPFMTHLDLYRVGPSFHLLFDSNSWVPFLPTSLKWLSLPGVVDPFLIHPSLLPRSLTVLNHGSHPWNPISQDQFPPGLIQIKCIGGDCDASHCTPLNLPPDFTPHIPSLRHLTMMDFSRPTQFNARIEIFRFTDVHPPYLGHQSQPNGWINFASACLLGRLDVLELVLQHMALPISANDLEEDELEHLDSLFKSMPENVLKWLCDQGVIIGMN